MAALLPSRVAPQVARAAGFALDDPMEITVLVDECDRPNLKNRLAQAAAVASESVPSVQPQFTILSVEQWTERMDGKHPRLITTSGWHRIPLHDGMTRRAALNGPRATQSTRKAVECARGPHTTKPGHSAKPEHH